MTRRGGNPKDGYVTVTGPGECEKLPLRYFNHDEGTALNVARSKAITWASRAHDACTCYVRDESENVYCRVERFDNGVVQVVMT